MSDELAVQLTRDELDLLCHGFGFFVQEFPLVDDAPERALLSKLFALRDKCESGQSTE